MILLDMIIATAAVLVVFVVGFLLDFGAGFEHSSPRPSPISTNATAKINVATWATTLVVKYVSEMSAVTSVPATWPVRRTNNAPSWENPSGDEDQDEMWWDWVL
jgi:hypothetical protein